MSFRSRTEETFNSQTLSVRSCQGGKVDVLLRRYDEVDPKLALI